MAISDDIAAGPSTAPAAVALTKDQQSALREIGLEPKEGFFYGTRIPFNTVIRVTTDESVVARCRIRTPPPELVQQQKRIEVPTYKTYEDNEVAYPRPKAGQKWTVPMADTTYERAQRKAVAMERRVKESELKKLEHDRAKIKSHLARLQNQGQRPTSLKRQIAAKASGSEPSALVSGALTKEEIERQAEIKLTEETLRRYEEALKPPEFETDPLKLYPTRVPRKFLRKSGKYKLDNGEAQEPANAAASTSKVTTSREEDDKAEAETLPKGRGKRKERRDDGDSAGVKTTKNIGRHRKTAVTVEIEAHAPQAVPVSKNAQFVYNGSDSELDDLTKSESESIDSQPKPESPRRTAAGRKGKGSQKAAQAVETEDESMAAGSDSPSINSASSVEIVKKANSRSDRLKRRSESGSQPAKKKPRKGRQKGQIDVAESSKQDIEMTAIDEQFNLIDHTQRDDTKL